MHPTKKEHFLRLRKTELELIRLDLEEKKLVQYSFFMRLESEKSLTPPFSFVRV